MARRISSSIRRSAATALRTPAFNSTTWRLEKGIGLSYLHLERGQLILRAEVQNIGNHNNIGPLDTTVNDIGNGNYLNRKNATEDPGRIMVLWAKIAF